jgi:predicted transcriptional regulator
MVKMGKQDILNVFFREKPAKMIIEMRRNSKTEIYASHLAKSVDCTYSHVVKILQQMQKAGLVNFDKQGRLKLLSLTKKGEEVANSIDKVMMLLKE